MNKVEINEQMWAVAKESSVVSSCVHKFGKECRRFHRVRVTMTRKFFHKDTKQKYILCQSLYNGVTGAITLAEVDHGKQKWYYLISEDLTDSTDAYSTMYPMSKDIPLYKHLIQVLSMYRLTMGQPRQEELLEMLQGLISYEQIKQLMFDLSPFNKAKNHSE